MLSHQPSCSSALRWSIAALMMAVGGMIWATPTRAAALPKEATGASIDLTAYEITLYVDPQGDDSREGQTAEQALQSLGAALEQAKGHLNQGAGVRVLLAPGVYREGYLHLHGDHDLTDAGREALLIIEGAARDQVTVSGAVVAGWEPHTWEARPVDAGMHVYRHDWPYDWDVIDEEPDDVLIGFREMVIFNGQMLKQEASADALRPGRFHIDRDGQSIEIALDRQMLPGDQVEIAEKQSLLTIKRKHNLVLRNLNFLHSNPHIAGGEHGCVEDPWGRAVEICTHGVADAEPNRNILIEACSFSLHNAAAVRVINARDVTLRNVKANTNGWKGIGLSFARNALLEDCETSYNAWRQLWSTSRFHDSGGIKIIPFCDVVTLRRHAAIDNTVTHGIWTDWGNTNIILDEVRVSGHSAPPIHLEMGKGPHLIRNSHIKNEVGILIRGSSNLTFDGNHIEAERGVLISLQEDSRQLNGERLYNEYMTLRNNRLVVGRGRIFNATANWQRLYNTLTSEANTYVFGQVEQGQLGLYFSTQEVMSFQDWQANGFDAQSILIVSDQVQRRGSE
ncbi:MAG: right-handed parallel beta-helix repeat-containing protein [Phycisphaeraceae bacterium]